MMLGLEDSKVLGASGGLVLGLEDGTLLAKLLGTEVGCELHGLESGLLLGWGTAKYWTSHYVRRPAHHWAKGWAWRTAQCLCLHSV